MQRAQTEHCFAARNSVAERFNRGIDQRQSRAIADQTADRAKGDIQCGQLNVLAGNRLFKAAAVALAVSGMRTVAVDRPLAVPVAAM